MRYLADLNLSIIKDKMLLVLLTSAVLILHPLGQALIFGVNFYFMIVFFCCDRLPSRFMVLLALGGLYVDALSMRPLGTCIFELLSVWVVTRAIHALMPQWTFFVDWLIFALCYLGYVLVFMFVLPPSIHASVPLKGYYGLNILLTLAMYPFLIQLYALCLPKTMEGGRVHG